MVTDTISDPSSLSPSRIIGHPLGVSTYVGWVILVSQCHLSSHCISHFCLPCHQYVDLCSTFPIWLVYTADLDRPTFIFVMVIECCSSLRVRSYTCKSKPAGRCKAWAILSWPIEVFHHCMHVSNSVKNLFLPINTDIQAVKEYASLITIFNHAVIFSWTMYSISLNYCKLHCWLHCSAKTLFQIYTYSRLMPYFGTQLVH